MASIRGDGIRVNFDVVLTERLSRGGKVTSSPIEGNKQINDHFVKNPNSLAITGVCSRGAANKLNNLNRLFNNGILCTYRGINSISNVVITKFDTDHGGSYGRGFNFSMTLTYVNISSSQEFTAATGLTNGENSAQAQEQSNIGATSPSDELIDAATALAAAALAAGVIGIY